MPVFAFITGYEITQMDLLAQFTFVLILLGILAAILTNSLSAFMPKPLGNRAYRVKLLFTEVALDAVFTKPRTNWHFGHFVEAIDMH